MSNIIAVNKQTKSQIIVENFVSDSKTAIKWWKEWGMSNCDYIAKSNRIFLKRGM